MVSMQVIAIQSKNRASEAQFSFIVATVHSLKSQLEVTAALSQIFSSIHPEHELLIGCL